MKTHQPGEPATENALARLCARFRLDVDREGQLAAILECLEGDALAPTTVRDRASALDVHLADSLAALDLAPLHDAAAIVDLGSGAGFPGLPLAVALPTVEVSLLESQRRKADFIAGLCDAAGIGNARIVCTRIEEWQDGLGRIDVALARALASAPVVLEYAAPLLRMGGTLVDWRGRRNATEEQQAAQAASQLGLRLVEMRHVEPYAGAREHHLHLYTKVTATPPRFPRRAGVARRRPLGC